LAFAFQRAYPPTSTISSISIPVAGGREHQSDLLQPARGPDGQIAQISLSRRPTYASCRPESPLRRPSVHASAVPIMHLGLIMPDALPTAGERPGQQLRPHPLSTSAASSDSAGRQAAQLRCHLDLPASVQWPHAPPTFPLRSTRRPSSSLRSAQIGTRE